MPNSLSAETFLAYWMCDVPEGPLPDAAPASVDTVALAFAVTGSVDGQDSIKLGYLTSHYSLPMIKASAQLLQERGTKVVLSINGGPNWAGHPGGWTNLNATQFAQNVARIAIDELGLDGVDLDNEAAEVPGGNFVEVIQALRSAIGQDALLTLPVYLGKARDAYLSRVVDQISYVSTMAYWLDFDQQIALYDQYADLVGAEKVAIGVAVGTTPFQAVPELAAWVPPAGQKAGMMLWNLNSEPKEPPIWCAAIADNLPPATIVQKAARRR